MEQGFVPRLVLVAPPLIRAQIAGTPYEGAIDETSVAKSRALGTLYRALAERYGVQFVDAASCEVSTLDCEHLTHPGHRELARLIFEAISDFGDL